MLDAFIIAISSTIVIWAVIRVLAHLSAYSNERAKGRRPAIFPKTSYCERCEKNIPRTKRLKSVGDHLFGGWACPKCGSEYDLLGNVRVHVRMTGICGTVNAELNARGRPMCHFMLKRLQAGLSTNSLR